MLTWTVYARHSSDTNIVIMLMISQSLILIRRSAFTIARLSLNHCKAQRFVFNCHKRKEKKAFIWTTTFANNWQLIERYLLGEDLLPSSAKELQQVERQLETALSQSRQRKVVFSFHQ